MNFDYIKYNAFNNEYIKQRKNFSSITIQMIDTMFCFINKKKINNARSIDRKELLEDYKILSIVIKNYNNENLLKQFELLSRQIFSVDENGHPNKNFLPLLIKLQCCVGIYPDEFLMGYAQKIFDNNISGPIIGGYFKDEYAENNNLEITYNGNNQHKVSEKMMDSELKIDFNRNVKAKHTRKQKVLCLKVQ